ncbi:MAG TPA: hypothetical protein VF403_04210, partial [Kofleriaceae bacterium]
MNVLLALAVVLTNDLEHARVTVAEYPGAHEALIVAWQDVPGVTPTSGAMVYQRDQGEGETRYLAIGGGGKFALLDRGRSRLIHASALPVMWVIVDPRHPLEVLPDANQRIDPSALVAQYEAFEAIAPAAATRTTIEAAIAAQVAQTNKTCGGQLTPRTQWAAFGKNIWLANQAVAILEAIESACSDKDYAAAVRKLRELRVDYKADGGALRLD